MYSKVMKRSGPEYEVQIEIESYGKQHGFDLTIVDTSAVYNPAAKRYVASMASESLPDVIGNWGAVSVWVELKARGQRSAINSKRNRHQLAFLIRKIKQGCFACVTDSREHFHSIVTRFKNAQDFSDRRAVLISDLPKNREQLALERARLP